MMAALAGYEMGGPNNARQINPIGFAYAFLTDV